MPEIFDEFEDKKKQSFLKVKEYKEKQIPIIGAYCSFFPREIAVAMGAIPVGLCSSSNETVEFAEAGDNPRGYNLCPGCTTPIDTTKENMIAFMNAAAKYGRGARKGRMPRGITEL